MRDTFLTVVELRQGTTVRHGMELYRHCQRQVELPYGRLRRPALRAAHPSPGLVPFIPPAGGTA